MNNKPLGRGLGSLIPSKQKPTTSPSSVPPSFVPPPTPARAPVNLPVEPVVVREKPRVVVKEDVEILGRKQLFEIPLSLIDPNPHQPRHAIEGEPFEDLVNSIRQHGIIQPLIMTRVGERYQIIAGERRFRAAERLGLPNVPAVVRDSAELEQLELAIVENVQRQNLNPVEEALAYQQLAEEFGLTQDEISKKVGKSRATVANLMRLLSLPTEMLAALRSGTLSMSHAKILLSAVTPAERNKLFKQIVEQQLPVRAAVNLSQQTAVRRYSHRKTDSLTQAIEDDLRGQFGTKVNITKRDGRGNIKIEFYSEDEFNNLIAKLHK